MMCFSYYTQKEKKRLNERWEVLCREAEEKNEPKP